MIRHYLAALLLPLLFGACAQHATTSHPPLLTAPRVDLKRYSGRWFEIARLPNFFQRNDSRAIAEYTLRSDGRVGVRNTQISPGGATKSIEGVATAVPGSNGSRLRVKFGGLASLAPVPEEGNYWILAVRPDYSTALVGTPDRKYLWLLARRQHVTLREREHFLARARHSGFPVEKVLIADWGPAPGRR